MLVVCCLFIGLDWIGYIYIYIYRLVPQWLHEKMDDWLLAE